jgi:hypothetical protein
MQTRVINAPATLGTADESRHMRLLPSPSALGFGRISRISAETVHTRFTPT